MALVLADRVKETTTTTTGTVTAVGATSTSLTGVSTTGAVGDLIVNTRFIVRITGVSATGSVGNLLLWSSVNDVQTPNSKLLQS